MNWWSGWSKACKLRQKVLQKHINTPPLVTPKSMFLLIFTTGQSGTRPECCCGHEWQGQPGQKVLKPAHHGVAIWMFRGRNTFRTLYSFWQFPSLNEQLLSLWFNILNLLLWLSPAPQFFLNAIDYFNLGKHLLPRKRWWWDGGKETFNFNCKSFIFKCQSNNIYQLFFSTLQPLEAPTPSLSTTHSPLPQKKRPWRATTMSDVAMKGLNYSSN